MVKTTGQYSVTLEIVAVEEARKKLEVGQSLSPIINALLKKWIKGEVEVEK